MENAKSTKTSPGIIGIFKQAYSTLSRHAYLIMFPLILDLFLLLGPKFNVISVAEKVFGKITIPELAKNLQEQITVAYEVLLSSIENYNLSSLLRTAPLGIPSLFSKRLFVEDIVPNGYVFHLSTIQQVGLCAVLFSFIGIVFTALYLSLIARANESPATGKRNNFIFTVLNLIALSFTYIFIAFAILLPGIFIISLVTVFSLSMGSVFFIILRIVLISLLIPFIFAPCAVVTQKINFVPALKHSLVTIKPIYRETTLFIFVALIINMLTSLLWNLPKDGSWLLFVGALGHAIVSTLILVAFFHFYNEAVKYTNYKSIIIVGSENQI